MFFKLFWMSFGRIVRRLLEGIVFHRNLFRRCSFYTYVYIYISNITKVPTLSFVVLDGEQKRLGLADPGSFRNKLAIGKGRYMLYRDPQSQLPGGGGGRQKMINQCNTICNRKNYESTSYEQHTTNETISICKNLPQNLKNCVNNHLQSPPTSSKYGPPNPQQIPNILQKVKHSKHHTEYTFSPFNTVMVFLVFSEQVWFYNIGVWLVHELLEGLGSSGRLVQWGPYMLFLPKCDISCGELELISCACRASNRDRRNTKGKQQRTPDCSLAYIFVFSRVCGLSVSGHMTSQHAKLQVFGFSLRLRC